MKWCEIFRTGTHTANNGQTISVTEQDLDEIIKNFSEKNPDVPLVIGHPKINAPAYGWVDKLKREGNKLFASFKEVSNEFSQWVNKGLYKNRSISLAEGNVLKHIGWLGAEPPAIKGLENYQFSEDENLQIIEIAKQVENATSNKTETSDFSEMKKTIDDKNAEINRLKQELETERTQKRKAEHLQFSEQLIKDGKISPAQKNNVLDLLEVAATFGTFDFSEGEEKSVEKRFKEFLNTCKVIDFSEIAAKENKKTTLDFSDPYAIANAIELKVKEYKAKGIDKTYTQILNELKEEK